MELLLNEPNKKPAGFMVPIPQVTWWKSNLFLNKFKYSWKTIVPVIFGDDFGIQCATSNFKVFIIFS